LDESFNVIANAAGGGGAAMGGAVFVVKGGSLTINTDSIASSTAGATPLTGGATVAGGNAGATFGSGFFVQGSILTFGGTGIYSIANDIADQNGSGGSAAADGLGGTGGATALVKNGTGTLLLNGTNTYMGGTTVNAGTLGGAGTIGALTVNSGGTLAPGASAGNLTVGNVSLVTGATFAVEIGGTNGGVNYDQLDVNGTVSLGGATLQLSFLSFTPATGQSFVIVNNNETADPVTGQFAQGASIAIAGNSYSINYAGGDGNDVVLTALNDAPTLNTMAAPVDTVAEDTQVEITFAEIAAQGDEADVDGTVAAFVVKAVTSGTLLIGTSPGTATAFVAGVNDTIDGTHHAYWTAAQHANGTLGAFTVVAKDNGGMESATPVSVQVNVTPENDAPVITSSGGGSTASLTRPENETAVTTVTATDIDSASVAFSIAGGSDAGKFQIDVTTGALSFIDAPNFEAPGDADANNSYVVQVRASDGSLADTQTLTVNVTDVVEAVRPFQWAGSLDLGSHGVGWQIGGVGDFNHDGTSDVLWHNTTTGQVDEWQLANGQWTHSVDLGTHNPAYQVAGIGDFTGDGTSDVLWRNPSTGQLETWIMANGQWSRSVDLGSHGADWQVLGVGDFNNDHTSDILFRNTTTGQVDEWRMADGNWSQSISLGSYNTAWQFAGIGDFDGDGNSDVLWRNPTTGHVDEWHMLGGQWANSVDLGTFNPAFQVAAVNDFNGDGTSDVLWRNPTTGQVEGWVMQNGQWLSSVSLGSFDPAYRVAGTGDFDHSLTADVLWHNQTTGQVNEWLLAHL
jgi:autotransporter-associated beta strand protein